MTPARASLRSVSTTVLEQLREAVATGALRPPLDRATLVGFGVRHQLEAMEHALAGPLDGLVRPAGAEARHGDGMDNVAFATWDDVYRWEQNLVADRSACPPDLAGAS